MGTTASGPGGTADGPPGNGNFTPLDKCTTRPLASATIGTPALPSEMAPIQLQRTPSGFGNDCALNVSAKSGGAGRKTGVSSNKKRVKGSASSPGAALMALRLRR